MGQGFVKVSYYLGEVLFPSPFATGKDLGFCSKLDLGFCSKLKGGSRCRDTFWG